MHYESVVLLRGVWGLEDRLYAANEIAQSFHLQSAVNAGALVPVESPRDLSVDKPPHGAIDLSDGANADEARLAAQILRQRRNEKKEN